MGKTPAELQLREAGNCQPCSSRGRGASRAPGGRGGPGSLWQGCLQRLIWTCLPAAAEGEAPADAAAEAAGEDGQAQEDAVKPGPPKLDYSKKQLEYVVASPGQVSRIQYSRALTYALQVLHAN